MKKASSIIWKHYDRNPEFEPSILPNGTVVNFTDWERILPHVRMGPGKIVEAQRVTKEVWMLDGLFYAPVVVEAEDGLLVFSTGETAEDGKLFRQVIREQISTKPVIGLFYDHAHYPFGAGTLLDGDQAVIIAHPDHNRVIRESGHLANPTIPEMLPHLDGRSAIHFGFLHPKEGPDAALSEVTLDFGKERAWLPATHPLAHEESITVGGIRVQGLHAVTDAEDTITYWLPEKKIVIDNVVWGTVPNIYTLRGDRYRPPELWLKALKDIRDLNPEIELCVGGGTSAIRGADNVKKTVTALINALSFIYDQTIRLTNQGVPPYELAHHIELPDSLMQHPFVNQVYGQFEHHFPRITEWSHGWFSGRAEDMHQLPKAVYAENMIRLAGGEKAMMDAYQEAFNSGEYLWAKDLAINLYHADTTNSKYRQALADVFRKLGQYSIGVIARNFYIAAALSLEGDETFTLSSVQNAEWVKEDYARAINHLRTRIDPVLAAGIEGVLRFEIEGTIVALHIHDCIAEFVPQPDGYFLPANACIHVSGENFVDYFRGESSAAKMLKNSTTSGEAENLIKLFDAFEHIPMYQ